VWVLLWNALSEDTCPPSASAKRPLAIIIYNCRSLTREFNEAKRFHFFCHVSCLILAARFSKASAKQSERFVQFDLPPGLRAMLPISSVICSRQREINCICAIEYSVPLLIDLLSVAMIVNVPQSLAICRKKFAKRHRNLPKTSPRTEKFCSISAYKLISCFLDLDLIDSSICPFQLRDKSSLKVVEDDGDHFID